MGDDTPVYMPDLDMPLFSTRLALLKALQPLVLAHTRTSECYEGLLDALMEQVGIVVEDADDETEGLPGGPFIH